MYLQQLVQIKLILKRKHFETVTHTLDDCNTLRSANQVSPLLIKPKTRHQLREPGPLCSRTPTLECSASPHHTGTYTGWF